MRQQSTTVAWALQPLGNTVLLVPAPRYKSFERVTHHHSHSIKLPVRAHQAWRMLGTVIRGFFAQFLSHLRAFTWGRFA